MAILSYPHLSTQFLMLQELLAVVRKKLSLPSKDRSQKEFVLVSSFFFSFLGGISLFSASASVFSCQSDSRYLPVRIPQTHKTETELLTPNIH